MLSQHKKDAWHKLLSAYIQCGGKVKPAIKQSGVPYYTGLKLINEGAPEHGLVAIRDAVEAFQEQRLEASADRVKEQATAAYDAISDVQAKAIAGLNKIAVVAPQGEQTVDGLTVEPAQVTKQLQAVRDAAKLQDDLFGKQNDHDGNVSRDEQGVPQYVSIQEEVDQFMLECGGVVEKMLAKEETRHLLTAHLLWANASTEGRGKAAEKELKRRRRRTFKIKK